LPGSGVCISPKQDLIVTGSSIVKAEDDKMGFLHFFDAGARDHVEILKIVVGEA